MTTAFYILIEVGSYRPIVSEHLDAARALCHIDFGSHATLMTEGHVGEIPMLADEFGITSFKYFMSFRGDEGAYMGVNRDRRRCLR